ncbi:hypothetical protein EDD11_008020 [Mortierella claussenii]|nr:hypothetical protein EDD11_008020 [Mortierella claussenii]
MDQVARVQCSILLLKEAPSEHEDNVQHQQRAGLNDPYKDAIVALTKENIEARVEYLAPMTTLFPTPTLLSRAIAAGYPNMPHCQQHSDFTPSDVDDYGVIWAFAVTSQNAVHAVEEALWTQSDPDIRKEWLRIPIYCLTGATLDSVKRVGFKNINIAHPFSPRGSTSISSAPEPSVNASVSFNNAAELVNFLITLEWPTESSSGSTSTTSSKLWFLTGETRMSTLATTLTAHKKPFLEVVVYETGERLEFEDDFSTWLENAVVEAGIHGSTRTTPVWLAGFSPRGVDITFSTLRRLLHKKQPQTGRIDNTSADCKTQGRVEICWAAIGPTTLKSIQGHLATLEDDIACRFDGGTITISRTAVMAKAPKPGALAEAILSCASASDSTADGMN